MLPICVAGAAANIKSRRVGLSQASQRRRALGLAGGGRFVGGDACGQ